MNLEKLEKLKKLEEQVRIGGKGTLRRKRKVVHPNAAADDRKLQPSLKKLLMNTIPQTEEVNFFKDDGTVLHFTNPKAQASLSNNTIAITGHAVVKTIEEMLPGVLSQLGPQNIAHLKKIANYSSPSYTYSNFTDSDDDDVPDVVNNFEKFAINKMGNSKDGSH